MSATPRISVCMPVLNRAKFLPAALDSVLAQTLGDWELLISDAGSGDGTRELLAGYAARDPRVRWFDHPGLNVAAARNALLREAAGEYLALLDSDDQALPERLAVQARFLDGRTDLLGAGSNLEFMDDDGRPAASARYPLRLTDPAALRLRTREGWGCFAHTSMMLRRRAMLDVGGYREAFVHAEDDDLFLRLLDRGDLANLPDVLVRYRCHEENAARSDRPLYRAIALASAHLRLAGLPDRVEEGARVFNLGLLREMLDELGEAALPVRLFWIGMLQFHGGWEGGVLSEEWDKVLRLRFRPGQAEEIRRHWENYRSRFPDRFALTRAAFAAVGTAGEDSVWRRTPGL